MPKHNIWRKIRFYSMIVCTETNGSVYNEIPLKLRQVNVFNFKKNTIQLIYIQTLHARDDKENCIDF